MRTVLLASLRLHARRYVAAFVTVVIGVTFVVTTAALSSAARGGLTASVGAQYADSDVVATGLTGPDALRLVRAAPAQGAEAAIAGAAYLTVRADGRVREPLGQVGEVGSQAHPRGQSLVEGTWPVTTGQALLDRRAAQRERLGVGDRLRIGGAARSREVQVVGLVDGPAGGETPPVLVTLPDLAPYADSLSVDAVTWSGPGSESEQSAAITSLVASAGVQPTDDYVRDRAAEITRGVDVIARLLLVFAAIALFVSALVIANTFAILAAQRQRELALLRCVGATRAQVRRSIRLEALVLGVVASLTGLVLGTGLGAAVVALVGGRFPDVPLGAATVSPQWYAAATAVGLVVTLVAAWLPTRRATAVSPLAALRPEPEAEAARTAGRARILGGLGLLAVGAALLVAAVTTYGPVLMLAGGALSAVGVLLLGPVVVPTLVRSTGLVLSRALGTARGTPVRLAADNAVRNPRRTATTAASLLVGVTLTTAVLAGMASVRGAVTDELGADNPLDAALTTATGDPISDAAAARASGLDGVARAIRVPGTSAEVSATPQLTGGSDTTGGIAVLAAPASVDDGVSFGAPGALTPPDDTVLLPAAWAEGAVPERVTLTVGGRAVSLRTEVGGGWGEAALVSAATLARLDPAPATRAVWLRASDGADPGRLDDDLEALARSAGLSLDGGYATRRSVDLQLDVVTGAVVGLLAISIVIALIGIANTLGLSVLERSREHALLRALGLTRGQLRATLGAEALLLSVVVTVLGSAIGLLFAWVGVRTLIGSVIADTPLVLPWGQLTLVVLVAGVAGLAAAVLPARRAALTAPAAGLAAE